MTVKIRVSVPGSCGELVQGMIEGTACLISCPIDKMAEIEVSVIPGNAMVSAPRFMVKTKRAVQHALTVFKRKDVDVIIKRIRFLPQAKGYASSTADILAALYGLARALGEQISPQQATQLAIKVEPSDSLAWQEATLLAHKNGKIMQPLGNMPPLSVMILDWGGRVNTQEFNSSAYKSCIKQNTRLYEEAFEMLREGIASGDIHKIGSAAAISAIAHQCVLNKPQLDKIIKLADIVGAPGVCIAHSGTLTGVLLEGYDAKKASQYIAKHLPGNPVFSLHKVIEGGPRYITPKHSF
jgi:L-threonine kinase